MAYNPNEPRDAIGRWALETSSAIMNAASDKPTAERSDEKIRELSEQAIYDLTKSQTDLAGLTAAEDVLVTNVIKDEVNSNSWTPAMTELGIKTVQYENPFFSNGNALAAYGYDPQQDKGQIEMHTQIIHGDKNVQIEPKSYDEKIKDIEDGIKKSQASFDEADEFDKMMGRDDFEKWKKGAYEKLANLKRFQAAGKPSLYWTIANSLPDKDDRFKGVLYHELGHMRLREAFNKQHGTLRYHENTYTNWKEKNMRTEMTNNPITDYGMSSTDEYFAENYAAYKMGKPISEGMRNFMHKLNLK